MMSLFIGILGVLVGGVDFVEADEVFKKSVRTKEVPKTKMKPESVTGYICNEGCVNLVVKQSCKKTSMGTHYADVEVCTREDTHIGTKFKCDRYRNQCFPYTCDQEGKACSSKCNRNADCQAPNRCIKDGLKPGYCGLQKWSCTSSVQGVKPHILGNGIETVNCSPYICTPTPRCLNSCNSIDECTGDYVCNRDGTCSPFDPNY